VNKSQHRDIDSLVRIFDQSSWREMHLTGPGVDLFLSKDPNARRPSGRGADGVPPAPVPVDEVLGTAPVAASSATGPRPAAAASAVPANWIAVKAPCLGTFYGAPSPGAPAFVAIGQRVAPDTELCLVEVMKLFTSVRAGIAGTVRQLLVADAALVEFDQPLFYIEPDA
jgi:acetyl-CoA carboxylase biotin carboxyl carrier protein